MPKDVSVQKLKEKAKELRLNIVKTANFAGSGHVGGSLSCADVLAALYFKYLNVNADDPAMFDRDRFILSKGHCALAYVPCLAMAGFVPMESLEHFNHYESPYGMHPDSKKVRGCDASTGSLGHGLPMGVGMALGLRYQKVDSKVVVLMGDGEQGEGSIYEAAMAGNKYKLDNLVAMIDRNGLQISASTEDVMPIEPIRARWEAFGWDVHDIDGNSMEAIVKTLENIDYTNGKPHLVILRTTKGFHVSLMENILKWHHGVPTAEEYEKAITEISNRIEELKKNC